MTTRFGFNVPVRSRGSALTTIGLAALLAAVPAGAQDASDHAQHDMGADSATMDHSGHDMSPEMMAELREKIALYRDYTDQQIMLSMQMMGADYVSYVSDKSLSGDVGLLVLAHGFREAGDKRFAESMNELSVVFPTAIGFGMAMMSSGHIQQAIDELEAAGAKTIIVIPAASAPHNDLMEQWEYIFGLRDEAAYATVPQVTSNAEIVMAETPGDDPLVAEILLDRALEISEDPANEIVIVVAHGPTLEEHNQAELAMLETLAGYVREDGDFADVKALTLQDDAPPEIREVNVETLRSWVKQANEAGQDVLIVTNLMGARSIQAKIRKDLEGLDYTFNAKGITEHPNFGKWMSETVRDKMKDQG